MIAGRITLTKHVPGPAPRPRATVSRWGSTERIPARTASTTGKNPSSTPNAIFEAGPRPKKSIKDGYHTTLGIA